jgi:hypothetical protein
VKKVCFILSAAAASLTLLVSPTPSGADEDVFGRCPDGYLAAPFLIAPGEDKNGNGVVCVKAVDSHINAKDDPNGTKYRCNGFPVPPPECANAEFVFIQDDVL